MFKITVPNGEEEYKKESRLDTLRLEVKAWQCR